MSVAVGEGVPLLDRVPLPVAEKLCDTVAEELSEVVGGGVGEAVCENVGVKVTEGVRLGVAVAEPEGDPETLGVEEGVGEGDNGAHTWGLTSCGANGHVIFLRRNPLVSDT